MPLHDFQCSNGHQFEKEVKWNVETTKCPECKQKAQLIWLSKRSGHRQLQDPVVVFKHADGSYSFPGNTSKRTPKDAERVEMRTFADYNREMRAVNRRHQSERSRHDEELHKRHELLLAQSRSELRDMMASGDNYMKDLCRHALEKYNSDRPQSSYGAIYSEAMEYDSSNREAYHEAGQLNIRGKK